MGLLSNVYDDAHLSSHWEKKQLDLPVSLERMNKKRSE